MVSRVGGIKITNVCLDGSHRRRASNAYFNNLNRAPNGKCSAQIFTALNCGVTCIRRWRRLTICDDVCALRSCPHDVTRVLCTHV